MKIIANLLWLFMLVPSWFLCERIKLLSLYANNHIQDLYFFTLIECDVLVLITIWILALLFIFEARKWFIATF